MAPPPIQSGAVVAEPLYTLAKEADEDSEEAETL